MLRVPSFQQNEDQAGLSVLIPLYNHQRYLPETLDSILDQSLKPREIIILNDASTDASFNIASDYAKKYPIIRVLNNEANLGVLSSLEILINEARFGLVSLFSSDDLVLPGFYEKSSELMSKYPEAGLCCSDFASFDDERTFFRTEKIGWSASAAFFDPNSLVQAIRKRGGFIPGTSSIIRKRMLKHYPWRKELNWHVDHFLLVEIGFRHGVIYIPETLAAYRVRADSYNASKKSSQEIEVVKKIVQLCASDECRDIFPGIVKSKELSYYGFVTFQAILSAPGLWNFRTFFLIRSVVSRVIFVWVKKKTLRLLFLLLPSRLWKWGKAWIK